MKRSVTGAWALLVCLALAACAGVIAPAVRGQGQGFLTRPVSAWKHDLSDSKPDVRRSAAFALG